MSSAYGVMDALQREYAQLAEEFGLFSAKARDVLDSDRKIMRQMRSEQAFSQGFHDWLRDVHGYEAERLSSSDRNDFQRSYTNYLLDRMRTRPFLQAQDHMRSRLQEDMQHLLGRIHREELPKDRSDVLVKGVLNLSSNIHSIMSNFNQVMNFLNETQGVQSLQPGGFFDEDDVAFEFLPSDFGVPMFSQRVCVLEEITSLQPQLEEAINRGDISTASRLGARVAGLQALLKQMAPPPQPRVCHLAITLQ
eukprot:m.63075 g.63075  ORF g.63075 m.63075 type:complete len:250 (+) comp13829_c0_seq3:226-975(+)